MNFKRLYWLVGAYVVLVIAFFTWFTWSYNR